MPTVSSFDSKFCRPPFWNQGKAATSKAGSTTNAGPSAEFRSWGLHPQTPDMRQHKLASSHFRLPVRQLPPPCTIWRAASGMVLPSSSESQRDSIFQPKVARAALPWVNSVTSFFNPVGVAAAPVAGWPSRAGNTMNAKPKRRAKCGPSPGPRRPVHSWTPILVFFALLAVNGRFLPVQPPTGLQRGRDRNPG